MLRKILVLDHKKILLIIEYTIKFEAVFKIKKKKSKHWKWLSNRNVVLWGNCRL